MRLMDPVEPTPDELRKINRTVRRNLRQLSAGQTWGFTILHTVYTPASDIQFPLFLRKLDTWIKHDIDSDVGPNPPTIQLGLGRSIPEPPRDPTPNAELYRPFENDVVEDCERLEGADIEQVRPLFKARLVECDVDIETVFTGSSTKDRAWLMRRCCKVLWEGQTTLT
jgi:hypothetical protein